MRTSLVRAFRGHEPQVHTPNVAGFHNVGSSYERRALDAQGDQSDWIVPSPSLLEELIDARPRRHAVSRGEFFLKPFAPIRATAYLAQRHLFEALNASTGNLIPDLAVDEYVIHVLRIILKDAYQHWDTDRQPERDLRRVCERGVAPSSRPSRSVLPPIAHRAIRFRPWPRPPIHPRVSWRGSFAWFWFMAWSSGHANSLHAARAVTGMMWAWSTVPAKRALLERDGYLK